MFKKLWARRTDIAFMATAAVFTGHFAMTTLYLMPPNPIGLKTNTVVQTYMAPLFHQRWSLFAPNPIGSGHDVAVQCRYREADGQVTETRWIDALGPHLRSARHDRFLGESQIMRTENALPYTLFGELPEELVKLATKPPSKDAPKEVAETEEAVRKEALSLLEKLRKSQQDSGTELMTRIASAECKARFGDTVTEVRGRLMLTKGNPFSERNSEKRPKGDKTDFPWKPSVDVARLPAKYPVPKSALPSDPTQTS